MKCIIIEDQPPAQRIIKKYLQDFGGLDLCGTFPDAVEAMQFLQEESVDIIFLDINLPKMTGLDFLRNLRQSPAVILTTAFGEFALESYELDVVDYLLKPFSFQRFVKAVTKATEQRRLSQQEVVADSRPAHLMIKSGYELHKVTVADIQYIKADAEYTEIHTEQRKYLCNEPLKHWRERLGADGFVQIHKSYLLNPGHLQKIAANQVFLSGEKRIPIGRAFKEAFLKLLG